MREVNLTITFLIKLSELIFLLFVCIFMTVNAATAFSTLKEKILDDEYTKIFVITCIVLAWYHLAHNNLFSNLRFQLRLNEQTCYPVMQCFNYLICKLGNRS